MDIGVQYLTFSIFCAKFQDKLSIDEHLTYNNEQFGGCLIKIKQVLNILPGF